MAASSNSQQKRVSRLPGVLKPTNSLLSSILSRVELLHGRRSSRRVELMELFTVMSSTSSTGVGGGDKCAWFGVVFVVHA